MSFKQKFAKLKTPQQREFEKWARTSAKIGDLYEVVAEKTSAVEIYRDYFRPEGTKKAGIPRSVLKKISDRLFVTMHTIREEYKDGKPGAKDPDNLTVKDIVNDNFMKPMIVEAWKDCDKELEEKLSDWVEANTAKPDEDAAKSKSSAGSFDFGKLTKDLKLPAKAEKDVQKIAVAIAKKNSAEASKITETVMDKFGNQAPTKGTVKDMVKKINDKLKAQAAKK